MIKIRYTSGCVCSGSQGGNVCRAGAFLGPPSELTVMHGRQRGNGCPRGAAPRPPRPSWGRSAGAIDPKVRTDGRRLKLPRIYVRRNANGGMPGLDVGFRNRDRTAEREIREKCKQQGSRCLSSRRRSEIAYDCDKIHFI